MYIQCEINFSFLSKSNPHLKSTDRCEIDEKFYFELAILDACVFFAMPFILILTFSTFSFYLLTKRKSKLISMKKPSRSTSESMVKNKIVAYQKKNKGSAKIKVKKKQEILITYNHNTTSCFKTTHVTEKMSDVESKLPTRSHLSDQNEKNDILREEEEICVIEATQSQVHHIKTLEPNLKQMNVFSLKQNNLNGDVPLLRKNKTDTSKQQLTLMLICLPIFYLLTTLPVFSVILFEIATNKQETMGATEVTSAYYSDSIFNFARALMYTHSSLNMILFVLIGGHYRRELLEIWKKIKTN